MKKSKRPPSEHDVQFFNIEQQLAIIKANEDIISNMKQHVSIIDWNNARRKLKREWFTNKLKYAENATEETKIKMKEMTNEELNMLLGYLDGTIRPQIKK